MGYHVREVTIEEKIKCAELRINELNLLINYWRVQREKERKTIARVEGQLAELNRVWELQDLELSDEEYINKFDSIYESIKKLEYE